MTPTHARFVSLVYLLLGSRLCALAGARVATVSETPPSTVLGFGEPPRFPPTSRTGPDAAEAHPTRRLVKVVDTLDGQRDPGHVRKPGGAPRFFAVEEEGELDASRASFIASSGLEIEWSEPDYIATAAFAGKTQSTITTSDPLVPWSLAPSQTNIQSAWELSKGADRDVLTVCVIDSGVDATHEDLQTTLGAGYDAILRQPGHVDSHGHGTMVVGVLAASPDNRLGIPGVLWHGQVDSCRFLGEDGRGYLSDAIECLRWCVEEREARLVSNSWGTYGPSRALRETMAYYAEAYGVMYVVAAGNEEVDNDDPNVAMYPAAYNLSSIVSVGATSRFGSLASFSNYASRGESVDIAAPGVDIVSTFPGNEYASMSGTSFSAPLVTGTIALMLGADRVSASSSSIPMSALKRMLLETSRASPLLDGVVGGGRFLDAYEAVRRAASYLADDRDGQDDRGDKARHPIYDHALILDATVAANGTTFKTGMLQFPGEALLNDSALTGDIFSGCPSSRYPRYDVRGLLADVMIPKHVFAIDHTDTVAAKYKYMQVRNEGAGGRPCGTSRACRRSRCSPSLVFSPATPRTDRHVHDDTSVF